MLCTVLLYPTIGKFYVNKNDILIILLKETNKMLSLPILLEICQIYILDTGIQFIFLASKFNSIEI